MSRLELANNHGVVALITSIIVSLLLIVVTVSGVGIMRAELRQATDFDLSVKAYFAAESGLEDALANVRRSLVSGNGVPASADCAPFSQSEANLSQDGSSYQNATIAYTCQVVTINQTDLVGELQKEETMQIDLTGVGNFNRLVISWNQQGTGDPSGWNPAATPLNFPPSNAWSDTYPAILEASIISYPDTASFNANQITNQTIILKPSAVASNPQNNVQLNSVTNPERIRCEQSDVTNAYECQATIQIPDANRNYVLRMHGRYSSTHYKIEAYQGNNKLDIPGTQVVIDVTGKAGDVFRRIQAKGFLSQASPLPFAILTDESLCKVLDITGGNASSETGCNP